MSNECQLLPTICLSTLCLGEGHLDFTLSYPLIFPIQFCAIVIEYNATLHVIIYRHRRYLHCSNPTDSESVWKGLHMGNQDNSYGVYWKGRSCCLSGKNGASHDTGWVFSSHKWSSVQAIPHLQTVTRLAPVLNKQTQALNLVNNQWIS